MRAVRAGCSLLHALSWLQVGVFISGPLARALPRVSALASGQCCSPPSVSEDNGTLRAAAVWARNFSTFPPEQLAAAKFRNGYLPCKLATETDDVLHLNLKRILKIFIV